MSKLQVAMSGTTRQVQKFLTSTNVPPDGATHGTVWDYGDCSVVVWERGVKCWNGSAWEHTEGHYIAKRMLAKAGATLHC